MTEPTFTRGEIEVLINAGATEGVRTLARFALRLMDERAKDVDALRYWATSDYCAHGIAGDDDHSCGDWPRMREARARVEQWDRENA